MNFRDVGIKWLGGSSFRIVNKDAIILINPLHDKGEKVDCILFSTLSPTEVDLQLVNKILKSDGKVVVQSDFSRALKFVSEDQIDLVDVGKTIKSCGFEIEATVVDNSSDRQNGFVIKTDETKIYYSGDTHFIPEMNLIECDVALLPINGKNSMDFDEAASAVNVLVPELVIPYNYNQKDFEIAQRFANIAKEITDVEIIDPEDDN